MSSYTSVGLLDALRVYVEKNDEGVLDGYEVEFPQDLNTLDPLFLIQRASLKATFEQQVELTKALICNKLIRFKLWGETIGEIQLNSIDTAFAAFPLFEQHPMALQFLIRTCFVTSLKNSLPPLNASQSAAMKEALTRRLKEQMK